MNNIYNLLGVEFTNDTEKTMSGLLAKSRLKRKGKSHHYSLEQFNLSESQIRNRFENYYETYSDYL